MTPRLNLAPDTAYQSAYLFRTERWRTDGVGERVCYWQDKKGRKGRCWSEVEVVLDAEATPPLLRRFPRREVAKEEFQALIAELLQLGILELREDQPDCNLLTAYDLVFGIDLGEGRRRSIAVPGAATELQEVDRIRELLFWSEPRFARYLSNR